MSIVSKSDALVSLETRVFIPALVYVTNSIITAEFSEMSSDEFKTTYLAPLHNTLRVSNISRDYLLKEYDYPFGDPSIAEDGVQRNFDENIVREIKRLYQEICGGYHDCGRPPISRPPLSRRTIIRLDIVHLAIDKSAPSLLCPEICFAVGDYKRENYYLTQDLHELNMAIVDHKDNLSNQRTLRLLPTHTLFNDREWSPESDMCFGSKEIYLSSFSLWYR